MNRYNKQFTVQLHSNVIGIDIKKKKRRKCNDFSIEV